MSDPDPTSTPVLPPKWFEGKADAEMIGHIQNKGWHDKPAEVVALEAIKMHREAEKFIGAPADQLLRLPKDPTDQAGWATVYDRLGAVKDGEKVDLAGVKYADGSALADNVVDLLHGVARKTHMTKDGVIELAKDFVKFMDGAEASDKIDAEAKLALEKDALSKNWGPNKEANMLIAKNAAKTLGIDEAAIGALESVVGYSKVMEMFRNIGTKIGEDRFVPGGAGPSPVMTVNQAKASLDDLKKDKEWVTRYLNGGREERKQFEALTTLIASAGQR